MKELVIRGGIETFEEKMFGEGKNFLEKICPRRGERC